MECRPALTEEIPWLTDTFVGALRSAITAERGYWDEQKERSQFADQLRLADTWVVLTEGSRVAFYTAWSEEDHLFLGTLCVAPEFQNRGIGTQAMRRIASEAGERRVRLSVLKANHAARRFYERLGCRQLSTSRHHDHFEWPRSAFLATTRCATSADRSDRGDLDQILRASEPRLHGRAGRRGALHDPLVPHLVHLA